MGREGLQRPEQGRGEDTAGARGVQLAPAQRAASRGVHREHRSWKVLCCLPRRLAAVRTSQPIHRPELGRHSGVSDLGPFVPAAQTVWEHSSVSHPTPCPTLSRTAQGRSRSLWRRRDRPHAQRVLMCMGHPGASRPACLLTPSTVT